MIGTPYRAQLARKRALVAEALGAYEALRGIEVPEPVPSPRSFRYRNQAKLVARRTRRGLVLGIYRPGTHQVADISRCPVHLEAIERAIAQVLDRLEKQQVSVYDERTGAGWLRYVVFRASSWQRRVQIILVATAARGAEDRALAASLRRLRGISGVVLNVNPDPGNVIYGERFLPLAGAAWLAEKVGDVILRVSPGSFLQANVPAAARLYRTAAAWVGEESARTALDLYSGMGALTLHLAPLVRSMVAVEESPSAVADAIVNARRNGAGNTRFHRGEVEVVLRELAERLPGADLVSVNPPRKGLSEEVRETLVRLGPARLLYVSCSPVSLARDLAWLVERGYRVERLLPFDFFPQTPHVECLALARRC